MCAIEAGAGQRHSGAQRMIAEFATSLERHEVVTLHQDGELLIRWLKGREKRLVLVFTGAGNAAGGLTADEFSGSASDGSRNHVLFISDLTKSYYSGQGLMGRIVEFVQAWSKSEGIDEVCAIGNSMGGTGAILMAGRYDLRSVLAFCPAINLSGDVTDDPVWDSYRGRFGPDLVTDLGAVMRQSAARFYLIFGDRDADDQKHIAAVPGVANVSCTIIPGKGHGVTRWLKAQGALGEIVTAATSGDEPELNVVLEDMIFSASQPPEMGEMQKSNASRSVAR